MSADQAIAEYAVVMQQMADRIGATTQSLDELLANPEHPRAWANCDFIALQNRKLCELLVLGSSLAHLRSTETEFNAKDWHPSNVIRALEGVNPYPLPFPVRIELNKNGAGQHHLTPISRSVHSELVTGIYGRCGDLLHVPSAYRVVQGRLGSFEVERFQRWLTGWKSLLMGHILFLPEIENIILCQWTGQFTDDPQCFFLGGNGPAVFNVDDLPAFTLLTI